MRYLKYILTVVVLFCLVSCYEVNEEIQINADGSGTYATKMDMGQLIAMMQTFAGEEELAKEGMDRVIDTVIMMKSIIDSTKDATAEQKELMKDGKMQLQMNVKESLFKINMNLPYKNLNNLQQLMSGKGNNGGMTSLFKSMFGGKTDPGADQPAPKQPELGDITGTYDVTIKNGLISRKINAEKLKQITDMPEMAQLKQMGTSGMEILYTTTIKLPRAAKKTDNPLVKLSDDKKTVTLKYNLLDLLEHPDKYAYTIEY